MNVKEQKELDALLHDLTPKEYRFIHEYIRLKGNGKEAAEASGYAVKSAAVTSVKVLKRPKVKRALFLLQKDLGQEIKADATWIGMQLLAVYEKSMADEPVLDSDGAETGEYAFDSSGALGALKELNKMQGNYKPTQHKISSKVRFSHDYGTKN